MVRIGVHVEQVGAGGPHQGGERRWRPSLAHVDGADQAGQGVSSGSGTLSGMNLGGQELLIVLVIVLVLFGGSKLPKLARSMGQAQKEFKQGMKDGFVDDDETPRKDVPREA